MKTLISRLNESRTVLLEAERSALQKEYEKYFNDTLKKYGADSPAALSAEDKTAFFNDIKSGWVKGKGKK